MLRTENNNSMHRGSARGALPISLKIGFPRKIEHIIHSLVQDAKVKLGETARFRGCSTAFEASRRGLQLFSNDLSQCAFQRALTVADVRAQGIVDQ